LQTAAGTMKVSRGVNFIIKGRYIKQARCEGIVDPAIFSMGKLVKRGRNLG